MAAKPRVRGVAIVATAIGFLTFAPSSLAVTGSVFFDAAGNGGAGLDFFGGGSATGHSNLGLDEHVMPGLTSGERNTALGADTLSATSTGSNNVAAGFGALVTNTTGRNNVGGGFEALVLNTTGHDNLAAGFNALGVNTTGDSNIALGSGAGQNLTTGSNNVDIANAGRAGESGTIRIGKASTQTRAFLAGVTETTVSGTAQPVVVNANGQLGTASAASSGKRPKATSSDRKLSKLRAEVKRQRRGFERQQQEIQALRQQVRKGG